jgi:hypothetical protein
MIILYSRISTKNKVSLVSRSSFSRRCFFIPYSAPKPLFDNGIKEGLARAICMLFYCMFLPWFIGIDVLLLFASTLMDRLYIPMVKTPYCPTAGFGAFTPLIWYAKAFAYAGLELNNTFVVAGSKKVPTMLLINASSSHLQNIASACTIRGIIRHPCLMEGYFLKIIIMV